MKTECRGKKQENTDARIAKGDKGNVCGKTGKCFYGNDEVLESLGLIVMKVIKYAI